MALSSETSVDMTHAHAVPVRAVRVILVDDDAMARQFMGLILTAAGIEVVAEASDGDEVAQRAMAYHPDVIIMDLRMARMGGIEATRVLRQSSLDVGIIAVTSFDTPAAILDSVEAGVNGFLAKDSAPAEITKAVHDVASGNAALSSRAAKVMLENARSHETTAQRNAATKQIMSLSEREREVLTLLMRGLTNVEIGQELHLSASTVKTHVTSALNKTQTEGRVQLAVLGAHAGLM